MYSYHCVIIMLSESNCSSWNNVYMYCTSSNHSPQADFYCTLYMYFIIKWECSCRLINRTLCDIYHNFCFHYFPDEQKLFYYRGNYSKYRVLYCTVLYFTLLYQITLAKLSIATGHADGNLQFSRTIKTIVNLHSMTCCYA